MTEQITANPGGLEVMVKSLLTLSPPILLAFAINALMFLLRDAPIQKWHRVAISMLLGAIVYPFIAEVGKISFNVPNPHVFNAVIGWCIGAAAVGFNQFFRTSKERVVEIREKKESETQFLKIQNQNKSEPPKP